MQIIQSGVPFNFSYGAYDQAIGLYVAASIYDLTNGTPLFIALVPLSYVSYGVYAGSYTGNSNKSYLVILAAYTSNTYQTVDNTRPPTAECYQGVTRSLTIFPFNYATYDLNPSLYVEAKVYNTTTGLPVYVTAVPMPEVALGVYYGALNGIALGNSYFVIESVYTDSSYAHVDSSRTPGNDIYQGSVFSELQNVQYGPNIVGLIDGSNNATFPYPSTPQLNLIQGETRNFVIRIVEPNYFPFDSTGLTDIQVRFLGYNGQPIILSMTPFYGGITAIDLLSSLYSVTLTTDQTQHFQTGEQLNFTAYLYFGNFATGTYSGDFGSVMFSAASPGSFGNVTLTFDGLSNLQTLLEEFADANPSAPSIVFLPTGDIQSVASLLFNYNPVDGQTLTLTGPPSLDDVYTFRNSPVNPKDVQIASSPSGTVMNLITVLNHYGGNNYVAVAGSNWNTLTLYAGSGYPSSSGNALSVVASSPLTITISNFAGGTPTITGSLILPAGTLSLSGGTDSTRIANFTRSLNARYPSVS